MRTHLSLATILASTTCLVAFATPAQAQATTFQIPAGDLSSAMSAFVRQSGIQIVYRADEMSGIRSAGISGRMTAEDALSALLANSGFEAKRDASGAFAIVKASVPQVAKMTATAFTPAIRQEAAFSPSPSAAPNTNDEEIIVTARKRDETSIAVPVAITAVGAAELQRRAISSIDAVARMVPSLIVGDNGGLQGGIVSIRGIAGADANPFGDQAVSFAVDGVQVALASVRRMGQMDMQQIEVLKGPQALFFGKNSPGGIIAIRTADPTDTLQGKLSAGYELNADEFRTEGFISGPVTDTLGFRVAGYYSDIKGWMHNDVPRDQTYIGVFPSKHKRAPWGNEFAGRVTLKWEPSDSFDARLKFNVNRARGSGANSLLEIVACAGPVPQGAISPPGVPTPDCKANGHNHVGDFGPNIGRYNPAFRDGHGFLDQDQYLGAFEMNFRPSDDLTLTSVTGYYKVHMNQLTSYSANYLDAGVPPMTLLAIRQDLDLRQVSQELRLASSFDGPINFLVGGLYSDTHGDISSRSFIDMLNPTPILIYRYVQNGEAYSVFGQLMVEPLEGLELSGGGRYSHEGKKLPNIFTGGAATGGNPTIEYAGTALTKREISFNNFSPELTAAYRPTRNLTVYGSYKHGFLSGGFSAAGNPPSTGRVDYGQQKTKGFEAGIKARLLGGALRTNLTAYNYRTTGLQVSVVTQGIVQELRNAGVVRTKGVEFDFDYRTPLEGLSFKGAVNYNHGRYLDYQPACYRGQTSATCFIQINRTTGETGLAQDLSGTQLVRAPAWVGNIGLNYETPVTSGMKIGLSANATYSDSYFGDTISTPNGRQKSYTLLDATVRLSDTDDKWEFALIGRNLSNKFYYARSGDIPFTGTNPGCSPIIAGAPANCTGAHVSNPTLGDTYAVINRGRELMLRVSYRFGGR